MINQKKIGVSLSGGGYRATAFHLGTLKKLNELEILDKVDVISTISGGSITGAFYCLYEKNFEEFENKLRNDLNKKSVIRKIIFSITFIKTILLILLFLAASVAVLFTKFAWLSPVIMVLLILMIVILQFRIFPVSREIEKAYNKFFFEKKELSDLKEKPVLAIGSTNLQTGRPFTFSKDEMYDSKYSYPDDGTLPIYFKHKNFPVARAVAASTCVPFAFTPISIKKEFFQIESDFRRINPKLVDGGVYDNQGIHKITQEGRYKCNIIITSDAGNKLPFKKSYHNTIVLLIRTVDVFMSRIKNFQLIEDVYKNAESEKRQIAYLSLGWDLEKCIPGFIRNLEDKKITAEVITAHNILPEWVNDVKKHKTDIKGLVEKNVNYKKIATQNLNYDDLVTARKVKTNLTRLSKKQIDCLMRHAENLTELQVKLYCPELITN